MDDHSGPTSAEQGDFDGEHMHLDVRRKYILLTFTKAELLRESLRRRLVPRSFFASGNAEGAF